MSPSSTLLTLSQHKSEIHAFGECISSLSWYKEHKNWCVYRSGRVRRVWSGRSGFWREESQRNGIERLLGQRNRRRTCKNLCGNPFPIGTIETFSRAKPQAKLLIRMTERWKGKIFSKFSCSLRETSTQNSHGNDYMQRHVNLTILVSVFSAISKVIV